MPSDNQDPFVMRIAAEWLTQYARFLRQSPEMAAQLTSRLEEFDLIPVPKLLLSRLAQPGIIGSGSFGEIDAQMQQWLEMGRNEPQFRDAVKSDLLCVERVVRSFMAAIVRGDLDAATQSLSQEYLDEGGRVFADLKASLNHCVSLTACRTFDLLSIECLEVAPGYSRVRCRGQWTASTFLEDSNPVDEAVDIELRLQQTLEGRWTISSVKNS